LLVRAFGALLETAVKFSAEGETIRLSLASLENCVAVIESRGRSIPSPALEKFFDVFSIGEALTPGGDLGLAPSLAHRIFSLFAGTVSVANLQPPGIRLTVAFAAC
jgi:K+-sensing histidine kinase KdpD